jgi:hypothetical protein
MSADTNKFSFERDGKKGLREPEMIYTTFECYCLNQIRTRMLSATRLRPVQASSTSMLNVCVSFKYASPATTN